MLVLANGTCLRRLLATPFATLSFLCTCVTTFQLTTPSWNPSLLRIPNLLSEGHDMSCTCTLKFKLTTPWKKPLQSWNTSLLGIPSLFSEPACHVHIWFDNTLKKPMHSWNPRVLGIPSLFSEASFELQKLKSLWNYKLFCQHCCHCYFIRHFPYITSL
jgi:hypothetical protein